MKDSAKILNINYSTAKTILRIFRLEKRISKKNSPDINCLRDIKSDSRKKFQIIRNKKADFTEKSLSDLAYESISHSTFLTNSNLVNNANVTNNSIQAQQQLLIKNIQDAFPALADEVNLFNLNPSNESAKANLSLAISKLNNEANFLAHSQPINLLSFCNNENNNGEVSGYGKGITNNNSNIVNSPFLEQTNNLVIFMNLSHTIQNLASMVSVCYENLKLNQNMINLIINQISNG